MTVIVWLGSPHEELYEGLQQQEAENHCCRDSLLQRGADVRGQRAEKCLGKRQTSRDVEHTECKD